MLDGIDRLDGFGGEVLLPGSAAYDAARRPGVPGVADLRPAVVLRCTSESDVARGLALTRDEGLPVVSRGGGHCFAGRSSTTGVLLDLTPMSAVEVIDDGRARIGAGARLGQVYAVLHRHGRTLPAGCGETVGITGLTLGGGIGLLGRRYGLTSDRLLAARVVLTNGDVVSCDAEHEAELFWGLRGAGGGQLGVVTSLTFATVPEPTTTRLELRWPVLDPPAAVEVLAAWQQWAPVAPDDVTANLLLVVDPGRQVRAVLFGASLRDESGTSALLEELLGRLGSRPEVDVRGGLPFSDVKRSFADLDPHDDTGRTPRSRSELFDRPMRSTTATALVDVLTSGAPTTSRRLAATALGGAYHRVPASATAYAHRSAAFLLEHVGVSGDAWVDRSWAIAHEDGSGRVYPNFPDPDLVDGAAAYHVENHALLVATKRRYDPDRVLDFPQSV